MNQGNRIMILAHIYAYMLLKEYGGSYKRALQLGLSRAKHRLR